MTIHVHVNLKPFHTFGVEVYCNTLIKVSTIEETLEFLDLNLSPFVVLGGGSNVLFLNDYDGTILHNAIMGIDIVEENEDDVYVRVGAGESWHGFVMWAVDRKLWGVENLSLIPGSVGAAPMQNIGAYGIEQNRCFHQLEAIEIASSNQKIFTKIECEFGYRESIFKRQYMNQFIITHVTYLLSKKPRPVLQYADVAARVGEHGQLDIKKISDTIIAIRQEKLPDPQQVGNAGSFFKNPVIDKKQFDELISQYPHIAHYPSGDKIKLAAAWLIDQCGYKGKTVGQTGSYKNQALVIVNHGGASGSEIYAYACEIQDSVYQKFGVQLEMEVNIIQYVNEDSQV